MSSPGPIPVHVDAAQQIGPMRINHVSLGAGGASADPMWESRIAEIRALHPKLIRLFIQEYFDLLPEKGRYQFEKLDHSVDVILKTGATPIMAIAFKPRVLFPVIDQDIVEPDDYPAWDELIFQLVEHYRKRNPEISFWEISNEPDIGEDGGCPYRFQPESYVRYYQHTVAAILRASPAARVGGPALADYKSPIMAALLEFCQRSQTPLHFISWHAYTCDPRRVRTSIDDIKVLVAKYPHLHPETMINEWNIDFSPRDVRFQSCYIAEAVYQMTEGGLDYSNYFHIRDYHVDPEVFKHFMSPGGTRFMCRWWNRNGQPHGLFDFQNNVRPSYFAFKLLSRLTGRRLRLTAGPGPVHGLATHDPEMDAWNVLLWNFSGDTVHVDLSIAGLPGPMTARPQVLDAATPSNDENARLRGEPHVKLESTTRAELKGIELEPWGVRYWLIDPRR